MSPLLSALVAAGLLSQDAADRITRQLDPEAARVFAEQQIQDAFQRGLTAQQRRILDLADATEGQPTEAQLERLWAGEDELLWASVGNDLAAVAIDSAVSATITASVGVQINDDTWKLVNENVLTWLDEYYVNPDAGNFGSIPNLNDRSKTAFANAFRDWQRGELGVSGRLATGEIRQGLDALIVALEPIFGASRAERIAITETTRIFAQSELAAGEANEFIACWQYLTANDGGVDDTCRPAANTIMMKGETNFPDGGPPPPRHPRCRCSITQLTGPALEALREEGLVNG